MFESEAPPRARTKVALVLTLGITFSPMGWRMSAHGASPSLAEADRLWRSGQSAASREALVALLESDARQEALKRLTEIDLRGENYESAARWLEASTWEGKPFWEAQLAIGQGDRERGMRILRDVVEQEEEPLLEARLTLAALFLESMQVEQAAAMLNPLERSDGVRVDFLKARLSFLTGKSEDAFNRYERLRQNGAGLSEAMLEQVYLDLAKLRAANGQFESAEEVLKRYFESFPNSPHHRRGVELLELHPELMADGKHGAWLAWAKKLGGSIEALMVLHVARLQASEERFQEALTRLETMRDVQGKLADEYLVEQARWLLASGQASACLEVLPSARLAAVENESRRHDLQFLRGLALFQTGQIAQAHATFEQVRGQVSEVSKALAFTYNAVVTATAPEDTEDLKRGLASIAALADNDHHVRGDAEYGKLMILARSPDDGELLLQAFNRYLADYPSHHHAIDVHLARAEWSLRAWQPRVELASMSVAALGGDFVESMDDAQRQRADYLALWLAKVKGNWEECRQRSKEFLSGRPDSPWLPHVHLRMAEAWLAQGDPEKAMTELDQVSLGMNGGRDDLQVAFLKTQILQRQGHLEEAIAAWGDLIDRSTGDQQWVARHQQALAFYQKGDVDLAEAQWNAVIDGAPPSPILFRSLIAKAEMLTVRAQQDPTWNAPALELLRRVLEHPEATFEWKQEVRYRQGMIHQQAGDAPMALVTLQEVVTRHQERLDEIEAAIEKAPPSPSPEWFYLAGFEAVMLLEKREYWKEAARLADILARVPGPRAEEASLRARRIRVERWSFYDDDEEPALR